MKAILLAAAAGLCWGVGEVFTKSVLQSGQIGPITAIAVRTTVALPVLWVVYAIAVHVLGLEPRAWMRADGIVLAKLLLGSGLVAGAAGMAFFYASLHAGDISRVKPVAFALAPATAVVIGWLVLREPMTLQKGLAVALILAGVVLLTAGGPATSAGH
jgi:uncharacterized membrane protein